MKRFVVLQYLLILGLLLEGVIFGGLCVSIIAPDRFDVATLSPETLSEDSLNYARTLNKHVFFTYVTSPRDQMPSEMKRVEKNVRTVLERFRDASPNWIDFKVLDPSESEEMASLVSRKRVSRWHIGNIAGDRSSEKVVWSALVVSLQGGRDVVIDHIGPEHVPLIEELIVSTLENMESPSQPVIGVSAPLSGYSNFYQQLAEQGKIVSVDIEKSVLPELDVLYIIEPPESLSNDSISEIKRLIQNGATVIYADSLFSARPYMDEEKNILFNIQRKKSPDSDFLREFGLSLRDVILLDERCEAFSDGSRNVEVPLAIKAVQTSFNLKNFAGDFSGNLSFMESSALEVDEQIAEKRGFETQLVVTSSERAWTLPIPEKGTVLGMQDLSPVIMEAKQPVAVMMTSVNPFQGSLLVFSSTSIFSDAGIAKEGFGHRPFIKLLGRTFLSPSRIAANRIDRRLPEMMKGVEPSKVVYWRIITIFLIPSLAAFFLLIRKRRDFISAGNIKIIRWIPVAGVAAAGFVLVALGSILMSGSAVDLTSEKLNTVSPQLIKKISSLKERADVTFYISGDRNISNEMKRARKKTGQFLKRIRRATGEKITVASVNVDSLTDSEKKLLLTKGIIPGKDAAAERDGATGENIWNSVAVSINGKTFSTPFIDEKNIGNLEFLFLNAAMSAENGRKYKVAVASDMPRLSPAEAFEDYFKKQLSAPVGADVYSDAKKVLGEFGFDVRHVDQKNDVLPLNTDVMVWFQPRRPVERMADQLSRHLAAGGRAFVALQHYNVQQRQYSGRDFRTVYWPQPQYMDLNAYLTQLGIEVKKEVFMDSQQSAADLEVQLNRSAVREYERQAVDKPFLIRTIQTSYPENGVVSSRLGDLLYVWGNRIVVDESRMRALGLTATPIVKSSDASWWYDWQGGFLDDGLFTPPKDHADAQPLAVLVEGNFPQMEVVTGGDSENAQFRISKGAEGVAGAELILSGCSEMFKNQRLRVPGFNHDRFIVNMVAYLALGSDSIPLLFRELTPAGFRHPGRDAVVYYRALVIGGAPILAIIFSLAWTLLRRRKIGGRA